MSKRWSTAARGVIAVICLAAITISTSMGNANVPAQAELRPGVYVFYDWRNLSPTSYPWVKGGELFTRWNLIESAEGDLNWSSYDAWISNVANGGKSTILKLSPYDYPYDGVPSYVYAAGAPKVKVGSYFYPMWWHPTFESKYTTMISRFGQKYNNDPQVSAVIVAIGDYGEAMPGYGNLDWRTFAKYWYDAGLTGEIWVDYSKRIIDAYVDAFPDKPLFLLEQGFPDGNTGDMWSLADYAAAKGVNLSFAGLNADNDKDHHWFSPFWTYVPDNLLGRLEQGWPNLDRRQTYWAVLNALRNHATILSFYDNQLMDSGNKATFDFANKYAGKTLQTTPGVWSALKGTDPAVYRGHQGNYEFWLYQLNPEETSVPHTGVGTTKEGLYARRTDQASGKNSLLFDVDDDYVYGGPSHVLVTITYFDVGGDTFELRYDAMSSPSKRAGLVQKHNTRTWKVATFELDDARFINGYRAGDFYLYNRRDGDDIFHMVEVTRLSP